MKRNKFCLVVTVYNAQEHIKQCLESIIKQRYDNWECIIIDDFSTDFTSEIIKETIEGDKRFQVIINDVHVGCLVNRIKGNRIICKEDEDIIIDIDGDDKLADEHVLSYLNQVYQDENIWATYGQFKYINGAEGPCKESIKSFHRLDNYREKNVSHLRTYKNFLFKNIKEEDFKLESGNYSIMVCDMFIFYPICEMAGNHLKFIPRILYIYNNNLPTNINKIYPEEHIQVHKELQRKVAYPLLLDRKSGLEKIKIGLFDNNFFHCKFSTTDIEKPNYIEWVRDSYGFQFTFYTDKCLSRVENKNPKSINVAWLLESPEINLSAYDFIYNNYAKFDYVITHDKEILEKIPNSFYYSAGRSWIKRKHVNIYPKSKDVCLIASLKKDLVGHKFRYEILEKCGRKISQPFGVSEETKFARKIDVLKDFMYAIEVQNCKKDFYYTERLIDCFLTGTIPIFWGCPNIGKFFNTEGILSFDTIEELRVILTKIGVGDYNKRSSAILENFTKAHKYFLLEDQIYMDFIRHILAGEYLV